MLVTRPPTWNWRQVGSNRLRDAPSSADADAGAGAAGLAWSDAGLAGVDGGGCDDAAV